MSVFRNVVIALILFFLIFQNTTNNDILHICHWWLHKIKKTKRRGDSPKKKKHNFVFHVWVSKWMMVAVILCVFFFVCFFDGLRCILFVVGFHFLFFFFFCFRGEFIFNVWMRWPYQKFSVLDFCFVFKELEYKGKN